MYSFFGCWPQSLRLLAVQLEISNRKRKVLEVELDDLETVWLVAV